jgi:hypothetical protein
MRILYLDLLSPYGHISLNIILLRILEKFASVDVAWKQSYAENDSLSKIVRTFYLIPLDYYQFGSKIDYRIKNIKIIKWILKNIDINKYDLIFISSYETISFSLAWPKKLHPRVVILNHNNLDELVDKRKFFFFKHIPKYVEHIVFEEYMKEYLLKEVKISNKVWVVNHPIDLSKVDNYKKIVDKSKICKEDKIIFAPSGSNDENFIAQLVNLQKGKNLLSQFPFKLIVKSKEVQYQDNHLVVTKKYFDYEEYISYFGNSLLILLPYPKDFHYRISGALFDCFAFKKRFISSSVPIFKYYINKYPEIGETFDSINEFQEILFRISKEPMNYSFPEISFYVNNSFAIIQNDYSNEQIEKELQVMIKKGENLSMDCLDR